MSSANTLYEGRQDILLVDVFLFKIFWYPPPFRICKQQQQRRIFFGDVVPLYPGPSQSQPEAESKRQKSKRNTSSNQRPRYANEAQDSERWEGRGGGEWASMRSKGRWVGGRVQVCLEQASIIICHTHAHTDACTTRAGSAARGVLQGCPRVLQPFPLCLVSAPGARPLQPVLALQAVRDVFQVFLSLDAGRFFSAVQICFRSCTCL